MDTYRPTLRDNDGTIYYQKDILDETPHYNKNTIDPKPATYVNHNSYLIHIYEDESILPFVFKYHEPYMEYLKEPYYINSIISMDYDTDIYNIWKLEQEKFKALNH